jgi:tripartite-type tricarboxylate transporter receptor subunit TctC
MIAPISSVRSGAFRSVARRSIACGILVAALVALAPCAWSDSNYPTRPVRMVLTFGPGGVADVSMRILAQKLSEHLGHQFVVENRPGAGGGIALSAAASTAPDGYTLFQTGNSIAISRSLFKKLPYDLLRDFAPISLTAKFDILVVVKADGPYKTIKDVIETARKNPDRLNFGTVARGSTQNLSAELFKITAGVKAPVITFRSTPELVTAILRGDIDVAFEYFAGLQSAIADKQVTVLATSGESRTALLPDAPTVKESGLPEYVVTSWNGLSAPTGTPPEIVDFLSRNIIDVLKLPDVQERARQMGVEAVGTTPGEMSERVRRDIVKWAEVIEKAGLQPQ